ncbi:MAG: hypothetical protein H0W89_01270 [Candidatus Levybacteria bacterium]|nr:hypothetical protein [Candidatus Levybacteria bacterium]
MSKELKNTEEPQFPQETAWQPSTEQTRVQKSLFPSRQRAQIDGATRDNRKIFNGLGKIRELLKGEEKDDREPFSIRGHHLMQYAVLMAHMRVNPETGIQDSADKTIVDTMESDNPA